MKTAHRPAGFLSLALLLPGSFALGQEVNLRTPSANAVQATPQASPNTYGTASPVVYTMWASEFQVITGSGTEGPQNGNTGARTCATGTCPFLATAHLPNGAAIISVEIEACDNSALAELQYFMFRGVAPVQSVQPLSAPTGTGVAATPGCALFPALAIPHTVDNSANAYAVDILVPTDPDISFAGARIRYNLQVSLAPLIATFTDVPTGHPQFQFIEALVASGVTAGCGGGNYCPDASLTRGQMAVFLAKALGLHFPN